MRRPPAVAGLFYPASPDILREQVLGFIGDRDGPSCACPPAVIAPHAGYEYSGPIAGSAYRGLQGLTKAPQRVVVLSPSHRVAFHGCALSSADTFATPLGEVPLDRRGTTGLLDLPDVAVMDEAHELEHGIEVHLPFLQCVFDTFELLPVVVGQTTSDAVCRIVEQIWDADNVLIVVSSDLSHYLGYEAAKRLDAVTACAIEEGRPEDIHAEQACGRIPIQGVLRLAQKRGWRAQRIDLRNSGDTAGSRDQVVGYGAWLFEAQENRSDR